MDEETDAEISVRCSPALTAEFFYVMRGMLLASNCQERLEKALTAEERRERAREGRAALSSLHESLHRIAELLKDPELPPNAHSMFSETLASQTGAFETTKARLEAALKAYGLS
jgi:hypothetical protein